MSKRIKIQPSNPPTALLLGAGYVARRFAPDLMARGYDIVATTRDGTSDIQPMPGRHVTTLAFNGEASAAVQHAFETADIILTSIPPTRDGFDPALQSLGHLMPRADWICYLSATSVYGDRGGQWAFEAEPPTPSLSRGRARAEAEIAWVEHFSATHIFRLAGIYGPGRAPFNKLRSGQARAVMKPAHVVNRIHVDDISSALGLSLDAPDPLAIYNLADGHPAPPQDVLDFAADLIGVAPPPRVEVDDPSLSKMARSFYSETKRINVDKAKDRLGWTPKYSDYRAGLTAIFAAL